MAATIQDILDTLITGEKFTGRFDGDALKTSKFDLANVDVREHGDTAVAVGVWTQETTFQGNPNNGNFRFTGVFIKDGDGWKLLNGQLSPMTAPSA